jgi:hypothetical protein
MRWDEGGDEEAFVLTLIAIMAIVAGGFVVSIFRLLFG